MTPWLLFALLWHNADVFAALPDFLRFACLALTVFGFPSQASWLLGFRLPLRWTIKLCMKGDLSSSNAYENKLSNFALVRGYMSGSCSVAQFYWMVISTFPRYLHLTMLLFDLRPRKTTRHLLVCLAAFHFKQYVIAPTRNKTVLDLLLCIVPGMISNTRNT